MSEMSEWICTLCMVWWSDYLDIMNTRRLHNSINFQHSNLNAMHSGNWSTNFEDTRLEKAKLHIKNYLSIGALSQYFQELKLRGICFFETFFDMVTDVYLLYDAFFLWMKKQTKAQFIAWIKLIMSLNSNCYSFIQFSLQDQELYLCEAISSIHLCAQIFSFHVLNLLNLIVIYFHLWNMSIYYWIKRKVNL